MSIMGDVKSHLSSIPVGRPFVSASFLRHGNRAAVDQAFSRLAKSGEIFRLAQGVYLKPKFSPIVGPIMPTDDEIAQAIVEAEEAKLAIPGAVWALRFRLTTQVMMSTIYLTDGPTRHVRLGKAVLTIQHAPPRTMRLSGTQAGRAMLALEWLGEPSAPKEAIGKIRSALSAAEFVAFLAEAEAAGGWIDKAAKAFLAEGAP